MKRIYLLLFGLSFILISCDKSINGHIIDNFNKSVENVNIKIVNSAFQSKSDKNGYFKIDFAAGKFTIEFNKQNYMNVNKELDIVEQKSYPLGQVNIFRIPKSNGLFFKGLDDYIEIPKIKLNSTTKILYAYVTTSDTQTDYYLPTDSVFKIFVDSIKEITLLNNFKSSLILVEPHDKFVATNIQTIFDFPNIRCYWIKDSVIFLEPDLINGIEERKFIPQNNKTYVYINSSTREHYITDIAFAFKVIKK